jgi:HAD superfamily hydrolase (TIGR01509 family)
MRFTDLDAVTVDAFGTLVGLADHVPRLREGLPALGVERGAEAVARAFAKEIAYYREHSFEGRDEESLFRLRRDCVAIIVGELDSDLEPEAFVESFVAAMRFRLLPEAADAPSALWRRGLALAVVSNWDIGLEEQVCGLGLDDLAVITSAQVGAPKPDPAVFLRTLEVLRVRPDRALHVGDSESDEAGARSAGICFAPAPLAAAVEALS